MFAIEVSESVRSKCRLLRYRIHNVAPSAWDEFFTGDDALLCALDRVFDKASVFMMRGPSYRGRELDTYSVEAVPQATKVRGMQPKGV